MVATVFEAQHAFGAGGDGLVEVLLEKAVFRSHYVPNLAPRRRRTSTHLLASDVPTHFACRVPHWCFSRVPLNSARYFGRTVLFFCLVPLCISQYHFL